SAKRALEFIRGRMWRGGGRPAPPKDGKAPPNAELHDYTFLLGAPPQRGQAEVYAGTPPFAEDLSEVPLSPLWDPGRGGCSLSRHDHEKLIHRPKPGYENATPSGNGVAAFALQRLHFLTGESRYALAAERTLAQFHAEFAERPSGHATLLAALEEHQQ